MKKQLLEYFLKYVKIDTMSKEGETTIPSTEKQFNLARILVEDLKKLNLQEITLTKNCFVTALLPSNCNSNLHIGFIAHMDTIPGFSGCNVKPNVIYDYDGEDIPLNGITLSQTQFPELKSYKGKTLITTDGTTVLGADDKAGIAEIMTMLSYYVNHPTLPHVNIHVAFTPDEEIGGGRDAFDVEGFGCDYAYTVDGEHPFEINYENFNAASALVTIHGVDIHPGSAKNQMKNASLIAMEFNRMLPIEQRPEYTEGYEGFIHLTDIKGNVGECQMEYILRDHNLDKLNQQKEHFKRIQTFINAKYGYIADVVLTDSYSNMATLIQKDPSCVLRATQAISNLGFTPVTSPIRGGTDGARLTQMGLNTPNLGTGGHNCHGPYEYAVLEEMETVTQICIEISKE